MPTLHLVVALVKETGSNFLFLNLWVVFLPIICFMYGLNYMFQHVLTSKFEPGKWRKNWKSWEMLGRSIQRFSNHFSYHMNSNTARVYFSECQLPLVYFMDIMDSSFDNSICVLFLHATCDSSELSKKTCESSGNHHFFPGNTIKI